MTSMAMMESSGSGGVIEKPKEWKTVDLVEQRRQFGENISSLGKSSVSRVWAAGELGVVRTERSVVSDANERSVVSDGVSVAKDRVSFSSRVRFPGDVQYYTTVCFRVSFSLRVRFSGDG